MLELHNLIDVQQTSLLETQHSTETIRTQIALLKNIIKIFIQVLVNLKIP